MIDKSKNVAIRSVRLKHEDGTKDYHMWLIRPTSLPSSSFDPSIVLKRWGKVGAHGTTKVEKYDGRHSATLAVDKMIRQKEKKGYYSATTETEHFIPFAKLDSELGEYAHVLDNHDIEEHLFDDGDIGTWEDDEEYKHPLPRAVMPEEKMDADSSTSYDDNSGFGGW